jgi:hypothetical protein
VNPTLTFKARIASEGLRRELGRHVAPDGTLLQEPTTTKRYKVSGTQTVNIGTTKITVVEVRRASSGT